jgi:hypothetical protein
MHGTARAPDGTVYDWFAEGFVRLDTLDLKQAIALNVGSTRRSDLFCRSKRADVMRTSPKWRSRTPSGLDATKFAVPRNSRSQGKVSQPARNNAPA